MKHQTRAIAFIIALLNLICYTAFGNTPDENKITTTDTVQTCLIEDDPVIRMLDSLSFSNYLDKFNFTTDTDKLNIYHFCSDFIPTYSDSVYYARIMKLNQSTPCNFFYDEDVKKYINVYAVRKRNLTSRVLGLAKLYFPIFEPILDKYNIPLEIKYLAIVESALNPMAMSPARAAGIWQFIAGTGKRYDLNKSFLVDDRFDIYKSTEAACRHMRDLYNMYHNWELVLAAYNSGAGNVNRAIARSGGKMDFLSIKRFLPRETRAYVPAFIAVNYVMNYSAEHNLYPVAPSITNYEIDTVTVKRQLTFQQVSEMLKIPYEYITLLNPSFRKGIIPADNNKYTLRLPKDYVAAFINNEDALYAYKAKQPNKLEQYAKSKYRNEFDKNGFHTVRKGETLSKIADKFNCSIGELKIWNKLKTIHLRPGQKLLVLAPKDSTSLATSHN
jgi:membrane-bound lytic murein transglycosylase D